MEHMAGSPEGSETTRAAVPQTPRDAPQKPAKRYWSIREVSQLLRVKPHVLRYWETQFPLLRPRKSRGGSRMYQQKDIDLLRSIQEMLHARGYTIAGARQRMASDQRKTAPAKPQLDLDFLSPSDRRQLRAIREDLVRLRDWLDAGGHSEIQVDPPDSGG